MNEQVKEPTSEQLKAYIKKLEQVVYFASTEKIDPTPTVMAIFHKRNSIKYKTHFLKDYLNSVLTDLHTDKFNSFITGNPRLDS